MHADCTITFVNNCAIVRGPSLPLEQFGKIAKMVPEKSVIDTDAARMAQAILVTGLPADLAILKTCLAPTYRAVIASDPRFAGLSPEAVEWLVSGRQGLSSAALFIGTTGVRPPMLHDRDRIDQHPRDPDDLNRCILLHDTAPEVAANLAAMRSVSPAWDRIVSHWRDLRASFIDEAGPNWSKTKHAPLTTRLMDALDL